MKATILARNIEPFAKRFEKIQKKAKKLNFENPPIFRVIREYDVYLDKEDSESPAFYSVADVEVDNLNRDIVIGGWKLMYYKEKSPNGEFVSHKTSESAEEWMIEQYDDKKVCEHCSKQRKRNKYYIIQSIETGELMQIGSSCMKDYFDSISTVESIDSLLKFLGQWIWEPIISSGERFGEGGGEYSEIRVGEVVRNSMIAIENSGGRYFNSNSEYPTKDEVSRYMFSNKSQWPKQDLDRYRELSLKFDFDVDQKAIKWIQEYIEKNYDGSDFYRNLKVIFNNNTTKFSYFGYIAWMTFVFMKENGMIDGVKKNDRVNEWFGEVGQKVKGMNLKFVKESSFESQWGVSYAYTLIDEEGRSYSWLTSNQWNGEIGDDSEFEPRSFTIKSHDEYKDYKRTRIIRVR